MNSSVNEQKQRHLLSMLEKGLVMIHIDPRVEGVVVPEHFTSQAVLRLNIAYGFNLPALEIDEEGVYAVLSFSRRDFGCTLPWASVFAITLPDANNEGTMWPNSLPPELKQSAEHLGQEQPEGTGLSETSLRVVPSEPQLASVEQPAEDGEDEPTPEAVDRPRPSLRLVKD